MGKIGLISAVIPWVVGITTTLTCFPEYTLGARVFLIAVFTMVTALIMLMASFLYFLVTFERRYDRNHE